MLIIDNYACTSFFLELRNPLQLGYPLDHLLFDLILHLGFIQVFNRVQILLPLVDFANYIQEQLVQLFVIAIFIHIFFGLIFFLHIRYNLQ